MGGITAAFFKERVAAVTSGTSNEEIRRRSAQAPPSSAPAAPEASAAAGRRDATDEFAATGMGRKTDHAVTQVWLDLEETPAQTVNIRYEFAPQLVKLGILSPTPDPLQRRERARGFEPGFSPEPPRLR